jgi:hypothetical protein
MLFDAHNHAFRVFGGVPRRGIYDNMRTAIDKVGRGKDRDVNVRFMAMASHYLYEPEFCNPASGWEKGAGREERAGFASSVLSTGPTLSIAGSPERLAGASMQGVLAADRSWKDARHHRRSLG